MNNTIKLATIHEQQRGQQYLKIYYFLKIHLFHIKTHREMKQAGNGPNRRHI